MGNRGTGVKYTGMGEFEYKGEVSGVNEYWCIGDCDTKCGGIGEEEYNCGVGEGAVDAIEGIDWIEGIDDAIEGVGDGACEGVGDGACEGAGENDPCADENEWGVDEGDLCAGEDEWGVDEGDLCIGENKWGMGEGEWFKGAFITAFRLRAFRSWRWSDTRSICLKLLFQAQCPDI